MADDLCFISATDAIAAYKSRKLSPIELVDAIAARVERVNPKVNAFTYTFFDRAREQAKTAEARYRSGNARRLEGVPVVIKDQHEMKGEITTHGSRLFEHNVDKRSQPFVDRLMRAGGIVIGRSTTSEFASATVCHTPLWGVTRNPWNPRYTTGGSTGGGAAAVAAGMTTLSDGGDFAGSIRIPASCCGVFGYKPPAGRVPMLPPGNFNDHVSHGPITRTVADGALMYRVMAGPDPVDMTAAPGRPSIPSAFKPLKGWKIAYSPDLGFFEIAPEVAKTVRAALDAFRELGCEVEEIDLGWDERTVLAFLVQSRELGFRRPQDMTPKERAQIADYILYRPKRLAKAIHLRYTDGLLIRAEMYAKLRPFLARNRILLCPTLSVPAVSATHSPVDFSFTVNGKKVEPGIGWCLTFPFNILGTLPAATVPCGFARSGIPVGLQIVGRPFDDASVFHAAAAFERTRPWADKHPKL
jgi:Asp-tRNA(Asn)/Glu-tRNA(Gln) amidotransferase A subunit family amidase